VYAYTADDNGSHGELWTPVLTTDDLVVELEIAAGQRDAVELGLTQIGRGYRFFGEEPLAPEKAGTCNVDVVCPEGDPWREEIRSVAVYSNHGYFVCTGFMVNNTARDAKPLFMTANHCGVDATSAASLVVYWNYQSVHCGDQSGGTLTQNQSGATFLAAHWVSDFTIVELDEEPDPAYGVTYAGWERGAQDPQSAVCIHHPRTDEKSISFEFDPLTTTTYLQNAVPGDGTHLRVTDWDVGTTEPGSSGSPLFDENHRIVGQLHGGYAACGNDLSDWYGRLSVSWEGGGTPETRLRDWLDPLGTGALNLELLDPQSAFAVEPRGDETFAGHPGGPFSPETVAYVVFNRGAETLSYTWNLDATWATPVAGAGEIIAGATDTIRISVAAEARGLSAGLYRATLDITDLTGGGSARRELALEIGTLTAQYAFPLTFDPGWDRDPGWEFGVPEGLGGELGGPDPTSGYTGSNVFGYNLAGDYENDLPERHLTTEALDCSGLSGVALQFRRWLGVGFPQLDRAAVAVSTDGLDFTTVWENTTQIVDLDWVPVAIDISELADGQPTVYVRWTLGPTDATGRYCGWNLDDIEILAYTEPAPTRPRFARVGPNPLVVAQSEEQSLVIDVPGGGETRLRLFDLRGRCVRELLSTNVTPGSQTLAWDGRDGAGRRLASGVYIWRLETPRGRDHAKVTLIR
jgi:hypothetical protein